MPALVSPNGGQKVSGGDLTTLDFFSGSGLVTEALKPWFTTVWANDICPKKRAVYVANFGADHLVEGSITEIDGSEVPPTDMAWGSFPCQDLSLAGNMEGLSNGSRSALYWEWVRILGEMNERRRPPVLCAENVVGFLVADEGKQFRRAYFALRKLGYLAGALIIDAIHFLPQSRPRSFLVAVKEGTSFDREALTSQGPHPLYHAKAAVTAWKAADDPEWIWWLLPEPPRRRTTLADLVEFDAPFNPPRRQGGCSACCRRSTERSLTPPSRPRRRWSEPAIRESAGRTAGRNSAWRSGSTASRAAFARRREAAADKSCSS